MTPATIQHPVQRIRAHQLSTFEDTVLVEAPLEIVIGYSAQGKRHKTPIATTMRTPGDDFNLVAGWLLAEGIVHAPTDLVQLKYLRNTDTVLAALAPHVAFDPVANLRQFPISSACGWCGRDAYELEQPTLVPHTLTVPADLIRQLPDILRAGQGLFSQTGGAHAVALLDGNGQLLLRCEDVGRHNALDKLIGTQWRQQQLPLRQHLAIFSGRLGYELVQKSLVAGIQILCSIGAPSSAALDLAVAHNITVCGFVRPDGFNLYCGAERIQLI
jgi:FdhD protein